MVCEMKKSNKRMGVSPITNNIYIGKLNKSETMWVGEKTEITDEAVKAVFEWFRGNSTDEKPIYQISFEGFGTLTYDRNGVLNKETP